MKKLISEIEEKIDASKSHTVGDMVGYARKQQIDFHVESTDNYTVTFQTTGGQSEGSAHHIEFYKEENVSYDRVIELTEKFNRNHDKMFMNKIKGLEGF